MACLMFILIYELESIQCANSFSWVNKKTLLGSVGPIDPWKEVDLNNKCPDVFL